MTEIDDALARLAAMPVPAALTTIDDDVMGRIARMPAGMAAGIGSGAGMVAIIVALGFGMFGAGIPTQPARAAPFGVATALVPSTLLAGE